MKKYFQPFLFSFIPSVLIFLIMLIVTFDFNYCYDLLTSRNVSSNNFRVVLLLSEIISYVVLFHVLKKIELNKQYEASGIKINKEKKSTFINYDADKMYDEVFYKSTYGTRDKNKNYQINVFRTDKHNCLLLEWIERS